MLSKKRDKNHPQGHEMGVQQENHEKSDYSFSSDTWFH